MEISEKIVRKAMELGYVKAGITPADDLEDYYQEIMSREAYRIFQSRKFVGNCRIKEKFPQARSILSLAHGYGQVRFPEGLTRHIGRLYQGHCYNPPADNIHAARLELMKGYIREQGIGILEDVLLPERAVAARAGVGTYGKNNFLYVDGYGSFVMLSTIVMDTEMTYSRPTVERKCPPDCTVCMDACPTKAIASPGHLIPSRCIAYQTFSSQGALSDIPHEIREKMGAHIHGCDVCQEACPRNRQALKNASARDPLLEMIEKEFDLEKILFLDDEYYEKVLHPILYNYIKEYRYFRRNAAIAMGNSGNERYIPALKRARQDSDECVSEAAGWALGRIAVLQEEHDRGAENENGK